MKRVMILGGPGSGKTTMARRLGEMLDLPVTHIDALTHDPGWAPRSGEAIYTSVHNIATTENWIIEGNYPPSLPPRMARADCIVFLDMPAYKRFPRVVRRMLGNIGETRPDLPEGCPERIRLRFLNWVALGYSIHLRPILRKALEAAPTDVRICHLKTTADLERFYAEVENDDQTKNWPGAGVGRRARLEPYRGDPGA